MGRRPDPVAADVRRAARGFAAWRRTRKKGTPIPHSLWDAAVQLSAVHGVAAISRALKLDYYSLKKRLAANNAAPSPTPAFIELPSGAPACAECVVEFEDVAGARLRVHLKGHEAPDLVALSRSFWDAD